MTKSTYSYTAQDAVNDLGGIPSQSDLDRLVNYYPSYGLRHRAGLLIGMFKLKTNAELAKLKIDQKGLAPTTKQELGGHGRWPGDKMRKTVLRLKYLQQRIDKGLSKKKANDVLIKAVSEMRGKPISKAALRAAVRTANLP